MTEQESDDQAVGDEVEDWSDNAVADEDLYDDDAYDEEWDDEDEEWDEDYDGEYDDRWGRVFDEDDAYVRVPKTTGRLRKALWVLVAVVGTLGALMGAVFVWVQRQIDPPGEPGELITFEIEEGATVSTVASRLEEEGVIANATVFRLYARREGFESVQAGLYVDLQENLAMGDTIDVLLLGPSAPPATAFVTVPPGLTAAQIVPRLVEDPDITFDFAELGTALLEVESSYFEFRPPEVAGTASALEGFFFPETYRIEEGDEGNEVLLVNQMVAAMDAKLDEYAYRERAVEFGLNPYQLLVVASIIEREAKKDEDFGKVSQVIYNRLAAGMNLGIDATLLYAIGHTDDPLQSQLETDTPYNTRLYGGLPPTPIAMPSERAIAAAVNPEEGPWLFYVLADAEGGHFFTDDFDEFNRVAQESRDAGLFE